MRFDKECPCTNLLVGLLRKSELPKMQEDTATRQVFMYALSFSLNSNPGLENLDMPFTKPQ